MGFRCADILCFGSAVACFGVSCMDGCVVLHLVAWFVQVGWFDLVNWLLGAWRLVCYLLVILCLGALC